MNVGGLGREGKAGYGRETEGERGGEGKERNEGRGRERKEGRVVESTGPVRGSEAVSSPHPPHTHSTTRLRMPRNRIVPKTQRSRILASRRS